MFRQIGQFATSPPLPPPPMLGFLPKHAVKLFQKHKPHSSVSHEEQTVLKPTGPQPGFPPPDFQRNTHDLNSSQKNFLCFTFIYYGVYKPVHVCTLKWVPQYAYGGQSQVSLSTILVPGTKLRSSSSLATNSH